MTTLLIHLAKNFNLPLKLVTQAIGVLAKRRAGKSYTARRLAEQLLKAGQQVVIVDPKGDWWGIRSSSDGKGPGLPVIILGGERGDVKIEASAGEVIAKLVVEERVSVVLDLSSFRKGDVARFMGGPSPPRAGEEGFLEALYRLKAREQFRTPMMLVIDEADAIAPQKPQKGEERMLGAAEDIVRRGGQRGIGCTLITQRSAVLNKNVLTQIQVLIALRTIAPQDLEALDAWIDVHGTPEERQTLMASLPSLPVGEAWIWSPGWPTTDGVFERVKVSAIETFDSGATPKPGEKRVEPKNLADVDLEALQRQMAATIERAKADDPRELRKEIARLRAEVGKKQPPVEKNQRIVEKPLLTDADRELLKALQDEFNAFVDAIAHKADAMLGAIAERAKAEIDKSLSAWTENIDKRRALFLAHLEKTLVQKVLSKLELAGRREELTSRASPVLAPAHRADLGSRVRQPARSTAADSDGSLGRAERAILAAAVQRLPKSSSRAQLAILSGYSITSSSFANALGALRSRGFITGSGDDNRATDAGVHAAGDVYLLPTGRELVEYWKRQLGRAECALLDVFVRHYPHDVSKEQLADESHYSLTSSSFANALGKLRTLELVKGLRASEELGL